MDSKESKEPNEAKRRVVLGSVVELQVPEVEGQWDTRDEVHNCKLWQQNDGQHYCFASVVGLKPH